MERLLANVTIKTDGCWTWNGARGGADWKDGGGYPKIYFEGRLESGHRVSYTLHRGPIPDGHVVIHTCRDTLCVNPDHLGTLPTADLGRFTQGRITHCPKGHLYDEANTYHRPGGGRDCRRCRAKVVQRHTRAKRADNAIPFTDEQLAMRLAYFGNRCWICGAPGTSIDHVKPVSHGGAHALCNIRPACTACNTRKGGRWPYPTSPSSCRGSEDAITALLLATG